MPEENEQMAYKGMRNRLSNRMMIYLFALGILSIVTISLVAGINVLDRAGGGSGGWSSGDDDDYDNDDEDFGGAGDMDPTTGRIILLIFVVIFIAVTIDFKQEKKKLETKVKKVDRALRKLSRFDPSWDKEMLREFTKDTFLSMQKAWTNKDREFLQEALSPEIFHQWNAMLNAMDFHQQRNVVDKARVGRIDLVDVRDFTNDERDQFTAKITASTVDYTIDESTGRWAYPRWKQGVDPNQERKRSSFTEFWTFQWKGQGCRLIKIDQSGAQGRFTDVENILADEKYFESVANRKKKDRKSRGS